jgi:tRNA(Arg) A34 adenosine deaminase TadA
MIPASYKPKRKFMELAVAEAKRAGDRGDYPIGAVITRLMGKREVVIASAGNRVTTRAAKCCMTAKTATRMKSNGI